MHQTLFKLRTAFRAFESDPGEACAFESDPETYGD